MYKESIVLIMALTVIDGRQDLGLGGARTRGRLTPRTGSSWPPYPEAGRGHRTDEAGGCGRKGRGQRRRTKGHRLYAGFGGVVGSLTPRTGGGGGGFGPPRGSFSAYNRERYAAARNAANFARRFQGQ